MYNYFNFNGVQVNDLALVTKIEKPYIPANTVSTINVTSRDGEIFDGSIYIPITMKISLAIMGNDKDDYITFCSEATDIIFVSAGVTKVCYDSIVEDGCNTVLFEIDS